MDCGKNPSAHTTKFSFIWAVPTVIVCITLEPENLLKWHKLTLKYIFNKKLNHFLWGIILNVVDLLMVTTFCRHVYLSWTFHEGVEGTYFTVQQLRLNCRQRQRDNYKDRQKTIQCFLIFNLEYIKLAGH